MALKVAVQMDPIEGINIEGDTTFLMMESAQARGHQLFVYTHGKVPAEIAESSATQCLNARGVAERADIIITMVPDTPGSRPPFRTSTPMNSLSLEMLGLPRAVFPTPNGL